jgi:hypothetical protein
MSNICGGCGKKVLSGTIVSALDQQFHGACFKCGLCRKDLDGPFYGCDQLPFCESCIDRAEELDKKGELRRLVQQNAPSAPPSEPVVVAARPRSPDPEVAPASSASAFAPPSPSSDDPVCHKCNVAVTSGTVVNALDASWHEKCFKCFECNGELDSFYNFQGFPFCGNCIDAVEERGTVAASSSSAAAAAAAAVGAPPKITNAFSGKSADSNQSDRPHLPAPGSSFSSSFSAPPSAPPANASWQDRALLAEEQVRTFLD